MKKLLSLGLLGLLVLTGCGGKTIAQRAAEKAIEGQIGGNADVNYGDKGVTVKTDQGTYSSEQLPSDWPSDLSVYTGAKLVASGTNLQGNSEAGAQFTTSDSVEKVTAFYKTELAAQGWLNVQVQTYGQISSVTGKKGDRTVTVAIIGADGSTSITIGSSK